MPFRFLTFSHVKILYRTERHSQQDVAQKLNGKKQTTATTTKTTTILTTTPTTTASSSSLSATPDEQG